MSDTMKTVYEALLPPGAIWSPAPGGDFDKLLDGMGENALEVFTDLAELADIRNPRRTPILSDLEKEYGLVTNENLSTEERIAQLIAIKYAVPNTASWGRLQDTLRQWGITGAVVTPNDPAVDPDLVPGELLVTTPLYEYQRPGYLAQASSAYVPAGGGQAVAGFYRVIDRALVQYSIPDLWRYWRYFFWVGGAASGWPSTPAVATLDVDYKLESTLKRLVLARKPLGTWAILAINWRQYWTARTAAGGFTNNFTAVAYGNGLFVAVGDSGEIQSSPDGITWTKRTPAAGYTGTFAGVTYGAGLFVAVGTNGEIQTSPDGITWTERITTGNPADVFYSVAYGNGLFVAVGNDGTNPQIKTSPDGISWAPRTPAGAYAGAFISVAYGNGLFVAVGSGAEIQSSPDGVVWTQRAAGAGFSGNFVGSTYGNNMFVIVGDSGEIQTSIDGLTWTRRTAAGGYIGGFYEATIGVGMFVIVGDSGEIQRSFDGITWKSEPADAAFAGIFLGVISGNRRFVAVGTTGEIQTSD